MAKKRLGSALPHCNIVLVGRGQTTSINALAPDLVLELWRTDCAVDRYDLYGLDDLGRLVYHLAEDECRP